MSGLPQPLLAYLTSHLQIVARAQLLEMGYGRGVVAGWVRRGLLIAVERGVYCLPGVEQTFEHRVYAKVLRCGPDAIAGPFATLTLLGVEGIPPTPRIDVIMTTDREISVSDVKRVDVAKADRTRHRKFIPVLSAARALLEVAPFITRKQLRVAFDDARRRGLLTVAHVRRRAEALPEHPGSAVLLEFLNSDAGKAETEGERPMQEFLLETLPGETIEWQVEDLVPGRRLDAAVRRVLLGFEYDGREYHVDREADYLRDLDCSGGGVQVIRISVGMLRHHAEQTRAGILAVVAQRERLLVG
jgi:very-short-patch-repair endonuclease